ncbi:methyl-accepting chemotaxis protein [Cupriavidus sp. AU9028]|uniref:methyl-accepting chemotaxis protein n=1 Tax=Cupriavidus sp. AU9028 TaxID=2871157 RepID=UPI001C9791E8|nr:methyl-accepting chemotaxis protein [Cupriavidus sp. AU9028]MBY4898569.1 Tar ligand binding domain-containing protein [Cupriavidus sp. AU9028]
MLKNLKIAKALLAVVVLFVLYQVVLGILGYSAIARLNDDVSLLHRTAVQQGNNINEASLSLVAARTDMSRYSSRVAQGSGDDKKSLNTALAHLERAARSFSSFEQALAEQEKADAAALIAAYKTFDSNLRGVGRVLEAGDLDAYMKQGTQGVQDRFMKERIAFMERAEASGQAAMDDITALHRAFVITLIALLAASLVVAVVANQIARSFVVVPLQRAGELLKRIAGGDLTSRIEPAGTNEVGQLIASLKDMQDSLTRTVTAVRQGVDEINIGASEISSGNVDLSSRTEQQAASLEETAASMEELASTVKQNAHSAREANGMASAASEVAHRGHQAVGTVVQSMNEIASSSSRIAEIVGVIDSIAFQTNILALNAAVEAARAGEQGKGFAVVASEVRSLAQRSASAAREIKELIESSVQKVVVGSDQVRTAGSTMQEILDAVGRVSAIIGEISSASDEQARGIEQVNGAVSQMDGVTQQNAALVEEAAAAASSLESQARRLAEAVAVFRLPDAAQTDTRSARREPAGALHRLAAA